MRWGSIGRRWSRKGVVRIGGWTWRLQRRLRWFWGSEIGCFISWPWSPLNTTHSFSLSSPLSVLYLRYRAGIVTDEMLSMPKAPFLAVGLLEALGAATGMAAGAILCGASIPVLSQTFLVWQILLSIIFLGRRYRVNQLLGCVLVAIGVIITVASGSSAGNSLKEAGVFWSLLMIVSFLFQAADTVLKEVIFLDARQRLKGRSVDLFVVNSFGSAFQALFICLLLPFMSKLWGIPFGQLPNYLKDGAACFLNMGTLSTGCDGAPLLPLLFVIVNMGFNISLLHLLKISSAVVSSLASTFSVPISVYVFTLPLPYLGVAASLPTGFVSGTVVLVIGLLIYAWTPSVYPTNASPSPPTV
ncbi:protein CLT1, chloroplastic-like isoform X2 [Pyrus communis]|uniref:protein CLT1, chloroplastic-like isoform X2 n=1 Tax=Pyrus communis TaxID=23211 RepID=UPI0035C11B3F